MVFWRHVYKEQKLLSLRYGMNDTGPLPLKYVTLGYEKTEFEIIRSWKEQTPFQAHHVQA